MANNRIYLRCKGCGDTLFLGKTYTRGYYWDPYGGKPLEDRLNEFYDKHNYCMNPKAERTPYSEYLFPLPDGFDGCDGAFDVVYENNEGTGIEDPRDWLKYGTDEFYPKDGRHPCPYCGTMCFVLDKDKMKPYVVPGQDEKKGEQTDAID